ncbi:protein FAM200A-like [Sipha flava]|uniref:Protein FAM200A-like n=1 Tax=Sipha flava TaxID=143950 RepID=A0A8B8FJ23_9HEMI|nr:protein FAM200A-like [Sipha flava]
MGAEHTILLFYCNSRWLSKGNELSRVFELRQEIYSYLNREEHLMNLETHFMKYFPEEMKQYYWIKDPFTEKPPSNFTTTEEEQLIDISSDSSLRMQLSSYSLLGFWNSIKDEYPEVSNKDLRILIPFATSYLCEAEFSAVAILKSKYRSTLNVEK